MKAQKREPSETGGSFSFRHSRAEKVLPWKKPRRNFFLALFDDTVKPHWVGSCLLCCRVGFAFYRNAVALYFRFPALAGAQDNVDVIVFCFWHISVVEFVFVSDFDYLEAFGYHKGRELPEFLEKSVGVHDDRKVFGRVICCNSEIVMASKKSARYEYSQRAISLSSTRALISIIPTKHSEFQEPNEKAESVSRTPLLIYHRM